MSNNLRTGTYSKNFVINFDSCWVLGFYDLLHYSAVLISVVVLLLLLIFVLL